MASSFVPPQLQSYSMSGGKEFVRVVAKVDSNEKHSTRVLVISALGLVLCQHGSSKRLVKRFYAAEEIREVIYFQDKGLPAMVVRVGPPGPDCMIVFKNFKENGGPTTDREARDALSVFESFKPPVKVTHATSRPFVNLKKPPNVESPKQKMHRIARQRQEQRRALPPPSAAPLGPPADATLPPPPAPPSPGGAVPPPNPMLQPHTGDYAQQPPPPPPRPFDNPSLGQPFEVSLLHINEPLGLEYSDMPTGAVLIERATPGSPCGRARVPPGRLTAVNGQKLTSPGDFQAFVNKAKAQARAEQSDTVRFTFHIQDTDPQLLETAQHSRELHNRLTEVRQQEEKLEMWQWNLSNRERALEELEEVGRTIGRARSAATERHQQNSRSPSRNDASPMEMEGFIGELFDTLPSLPTEDGGGGGSLEDRDDDDWYGTALSYGPRSSLHSLHSSAVPASPYSRRASQDHPVFYPSSPGREDVTLYRMQL